MRGVVVVMVVVVAAVVVALTPVLPSRAAESWQTQFDAAVYGDVAVVGNAVLTCPTAAQAGPSPKYPVQSCVDGQHRSGSGRGNLNNGHRMMWTDVDTDPATFNSSRALVTIPDGADVAYAKLGWAGNLRCGDGLAPPGDPRTQPVTLTVNGESGVVDRFTPVVDDPAGLGHTDHQFHSAEADVTARLVNVRGNAHVTVGNVWTPQGFDCFGGWSLTVVWRFAKASPAAPAQRRVVVHGGHVRLHTSAATVRTRVSPTRSAGGVTRIGVVAYEGDWGTGGDRMLVNGSALGGQDRNNFFVSAADGVVAPAVPNNMSVDARTVSVPSDQLPPGARAAELGFGRDEDAYLVQSLAWSFPLPELTLAVTPPELAARPGDQVTRTATVTNAGDAPAAAVVVCGQEIGAVAPHATVARTCTSTAGDTDFRVTTDVHGKSLAGDPLTASAATAVDVLHPALKAVTTASPATVLAGQQVKLSTTITNTGDTPLSGLSARSSLGSCGRADTTQLDAGATATVDCTITAGPETAPVNVHVNAHDKLGGPVEASASTQYTVIHPRLTITAAWSADRAADGSSVTVTVTVGNPSALPISDVRVDGEPVSCRRHIPVLEPGQRTTYTCQAVAPTDARLTVSGGPPGTGLVVSDSAAVRIASLSAPVQVAEQPSPPMPPPAPVAHVAPLSKPAAGGVAAIIGVVVMTMVASVLSGIRK